jgi:hypothetical protein
VKDQGVKMKKLLVLVVLICGNVMAGERVILKDSKAIDQEVNEETVICSAIGYGQAEVKISIKELDGWTIFDHSNASFGDGKGLPCMTAGICKKPWTKVGFSIEDVIQNNERVEKIVVDRELVETRILVRDENQFRSCQRTLTENLRTVVGGIPFTHSREGAEQSLPESACTF